MSSDNRDNSNGLNGVHFYGSIDERNFAQNVGEAIKAANGRRDVVTNNEIDKALKMQSNFLEMLSQYQNQINRGKRGNSTIMSDARKKSTYGDEKPPRSSKKKKNSNDINKARKRFIAILIVAGLAVGYIGIKTDGFKHSMESVKTINDITDKDKVALASGIKEVYLYHQDGTPILDANKNPIVEYQGATETISNAIVNVLSEYSSPEDQITCNIMIDSIICGAYHNMPKASLQSKEEYINSGLRAVGRIINEKQNGNPTTELEKKFMEMSNNSEMSYWKYRGFEDFESYAMGIKDLLKEEQDLLNDMNKIFEKLEKAANQSQEKISDLLTDSDLNNIGKFEAFIKKMYSNILKSNTEQDEVVVDKDGNIIMYGGSGIYAGNVNGNNRK